MASGAESTGLRRRTGAADTFKSNNAEPRLARHTSSYDERREAGLSDDGASAVVAATGSHWKILGRQDIAIPTSVAADAFETSPDAPTGRSAAASITTASVSLRSDHSPTSEPRSIGLAAASSGGAGAAVDVKPDEVVFADAKADTPRLALDQLLLETLSNELSGPEREVMESVQGVLNEDTLEGALHLLFGHFCSHLDVSTTCPSPYGLWIQTPVSRQIDVVLKKKFSDIYMTGFSYVAPFFGPDLERDYELVQRSQVGVGVLKEVLPRTVRSTIDWEHSYVEREFVLPASMNIGGTEIEMELSNVEPVWFDSRVCFRALSVDQQEIARPDDGIFYIAGEGSAFEMLISQILTTPALIGFAKEAAYENGLQFYQPLTLRGGLVVSTATVVCVPAELPIKSCITCPATPLKIDRHISRAQVAAAFYQEDDHGSYCSTDAEDETTSSNDET